MGQFEGMSTLPASFLEKLETIQNANPEVVEEMSTMVKLDEEKIDKEYLNSLAIFCKLMQAL